MRVIIVEFVMQMEFLCDSCFEKKITISITVKIAELLNTHWFDCRPFTDVFTAAAQVVNRLIVNCSSRVNIFARAWSRLNSVISKMKATAVMSVREPWCSQSAPWLTEWLSEHGKGGVTRCPAMMSSIGALCGGQGCYSFVPRCVFSA